jgi:hypothetical protein
VSLNRLPIAESTAVRTLLPKVRRAAERLHASLAVGRKGPRVVRMATAPARRHA